MPDEVSVVRNQWTTGRPEQSNMHNSWLRLTPRGELSQENMVTCQRKKMKTIHLYFHALCKQSLPFFTSHNWVSLVTPEGLTNTWTNHYFPFGSSAKEMFTTPVNTTILRNGLATGDISSTLNLYNPLAQKANVMLARLKVNCIVSSWQGEYNWTDLWQQD